MSYEHSQEGCDQTQSPNEASSGASSEASETPGLSPDVLAAKVLKAFQSTRLRNQITLQDIEQAISPLVSKQEQRRLPTSSLRILELQFSGTKHFHDQDEPVPFIYRQAFAPGVNVVLVRDNEVGKSSIRKTIKFALTGDDFEYDVDVKQWITDVRLAISLGERPYTILIARREHGLQAVLLAGINEKPFEEIIASSSVFFHALGVDDIKEQLQQFFFRHFGLIELSWTLPDPSTAGSVAKRSTSWLTYFQALQIPDHGDEYLLCDREHSFGNQDGLILSSFLGLNLIKPLNDLGVELSRIKKEDKLSKQAVDEEVSQIEAEINRQEIELQDMRVSLAAIEQAQQARRRAVAEQEPAQRYEAVQHAIVDKSHQTARLEIEVEELSRRILHERSRARRLREIIDLKLHFTGLEVSLCPNCDTSVDDTAVERERHAHLCRLCGKPAHVASPDEIDAIKNEATEVEGRIKQEEQLRAALRSQIDSLTTELERLKQEGQDLQTAIAQGLDYAHATPAEDSEKSRLLQEMGRLKAEITIKRRQIETQRSAGSNDDLYLRIVDKARDVLKEEAAALNETILNRLSSITQELAREIGADSISDVTCSPLGTIELKKHDVTVRFTRIQNQGERLRIKLAFFLSMMRLGREPCGGRHPGLLLIDQLGSAEMVKEDSDSLARILRQIDLTSNSQLQVLCFTARSEFAAATDPSKVYGPQGGHGAQGQQFAF